MKVILRLVAFAAFCCAAGNSVARGQQAKPESFDVSPIETVVLGQSRWLRGGPASLRVIVSDHRTGNPVAAQVKIGLSSLANGKPSAAVAQLFAGSTDSLGTLSAQFNAPTLDKGTYQLRIAVNSRIGNDVVTQTINLERVEQIMLSSDKPLYQPGQTMHVRALALDMAKRQAVADQPMTFEIEDARGNKVFKKRETLSRFGVASVEFQLADEVNMGTFTIRAILPDGSEEKKVRVERYVLPKFKVTVATERPYYQPGDTVKGTVKADYFFGKPVSGGTVTLTVSTVDIGVAKLAELEGKTDSSGSFKFEYMLPASFVGQPFEQGKAVAEFKARVQDTADHQQTQSKSVPVVQDPVLIVMTPESRQLVPGLRSRVYIACGTPDGAPIKNASVSIKNNQDANEARLTTDALGMAIYEFTPKTGQATVTATVKAKDGSSATATRQFAAIPGREGIILRTDKTLAKVGDRLALSILSSVKRGTIYIDVIREKQTVLTRAESANNGKAEITIPLTNDMTGTLEVRAYKILPNEDIIRDSKTIVVSPANDLSVSVTPDRNEYKPGADATLKFDVHTKNNQPVAASIGLAVVDESVFALSEMQPGLEKIYFMLERELMEPKYEIHGLKPTNIILKQTEPTITDGQRQRAAAMLLAAAPEVGNPDYRTNTYLVRWTAMKERVLMVMFSAQNRIMQAVQKYQQNTGQPLAGDDGLQTLVDKAYLPRRDILDPWGHFYKVELYGRKDFSSGFYLKSAGPDGKWSTIDDVLATRYSFRGRGGRFADWDEMEAPQGGAGFGGMGGGNNRNLIEQGAFAAKAAPMAEDRMAPESTRSTLRSGSNAIGGGAAAEPRIRQYFPETMYWNPALITDEHGHAEIKIPMADSITTWRLSMLANTSDGLLGSGTAPLKVFQDFFVDIDLPISLTQNDRVEIPVAVYNYMPGDQDVSLTLDEQPWFKLEGSAKQVVHMAKNEVKVVYYPLTVTALGNHTLKVTARGTALSDAIIRAIDVTPDGKEVRAAINDRLEKIVEKSVSFPTNAVPGANSLWVKLYPGAFSQVVEGLDGLLRMPNGCFEQTSSTTYPNVLVTDYLKATKKANPELLMKAEGYINVGYQRLVTFECKGGGFSWFGNDPAHQILTAYGLLEFSDMAKVHDVDAGLLTRTQNWLAGRQKPDGTWPADEQGIAEGIINRQTGSLRSAAYIAWALAESGYKGPQVAKAIGYIKENMGQSKDAYTLALILNLLSKTERDGNTISEVANRLVAMAKQTDKAAWWEGDTQTFTGAKKESADLETTGLAAYGLAKWGRNSTFVNKVLTYLVQSKDSFGTWSTTQGTVWSMKALLYASANGAGGGGKGTVTVWANGAKAATFEIKPEDSDVMRQIDMKEWMKPDRNDVKLTYDGDGSLLYQIASRYYMPWDAAGAEPAGHGPLSIDVAYDKTKLSQNDTASVTVTVKNNTDKIAEMPLLDIGVPPGFTVVPDGLESAVKGKQISKYTLAARQIIVYVEKMDPASTLTLHYAVKAKYPIKARTPLTKVYPYYNPEQSTVSAPLTIVVNK